MGKAGVKKKKFGARLDMENLEWIWCFVIDRFSPLRQIVARKGKRKGKIQEAKAKSSPKKKVEKKKKRRVKRSRKRIS